MWVFIVFTIWEWLATAGMRLVAAENWLAAPLAMLNAAIWVFGVRAVSDTRDRKTLVIVIAASGIGTLLGVLFP